MGLPAMYRRPSWMPASVPTRNVSPFASISVMRFASTCWPICSQLNSSHEHSTTKPFSSQTSASASPTSENRDRLSRKSQFSSSSPVESYASASEATAAASALSVSFLSVFRYPSIRNRNETPVKIMQTSSSAAMRANCRLNIVFMVTGPRIYIRRPRRS